VRKSQAELRRVRLRLAKADDAHAAAWGKICREKIIPGLASGSGSGNLGGGGGGKSTVVAAVDTLSDMPQLDSDDDE
jgi:hypothetical protein